MLSYLSNRHYHTLTQLTPPQLRPQQPQKIYYRTHIDEQTLTLLAHNSKITHKQLSPPLPTDTSPQPRPIAYGRGSSKANKNTCPLCHEQHIEVPYHGHRHICVKCRNFVRDEYGHQVRVYLDEEGKIVCVGVLAKGDNGGKLGYYVTDHTRLEVAGRGVYATYAGSELVLILKDQSRGQ